MVYGAIPVAQKTYVFKELYIETILRTFRLQVKDVWVFEGL